MLNSDPKRVKMLGIDLRPRWRRRFLVVLTYVAYLGVGMVAYKRVAFPNEQTIDWAAAICVMYLSIFGVFSPLKTFEDVRVPAGGKVWYGWKDTVVLGSLDDWAKYKYGHLFEQASAEEQTELLRTYRVGNYVMPFKGASGFDPRVLDERELAERNVALHKTLKFLIFLLILEAVAQDHWRIPSGYAFLELLVVAVTAPKAIILWNEADPRDGDLREHAEPGLPDGEGG